MPLAFFSDLSRNLLLRTLIATAAVFLFLGFATGALPVRCLTQGLTSCGAVPSVPLGADAAATPLRFAAPQSAPLPVQVAATEPAGPTLTDNEVVSATFATLRTELQPVVPTASTFRSTAAADDTPLATRTVKTVSIHADGTPATATGATETPATQVAEAGPVSLPAVAPLVAPATNDDDAAAAIDAVAPGPAVAKPEAMQKLALVEEPAPPKPKKAGTGSKSSTVTGQGANVHASSGSSSKVVFALPGGSKVSVLETSHGWIHITDAKGRSGWMYKDYLS